MQNFKLKRSDLLDEHYPKDGLLRQYITECVVCGDVDMAFWQGYAVIHKGIRTIVFNIKRHVESNTIWLDYKETIT